MFLPDSKECLAAAVNIKSHCRCRCIKNLWSLGHQWLISRLKSFQCVREPLVYSTQICIVHKCAARWKVYHDIHGSLKMHILIRFYWDTTQLSQIWIERQKAGLPEVVTKYPVYPDFSRTKELLASQSRETLPRWPLKRWRISYQSMITISTFQLMIQGHCSWTFAMKIRHLVHRSSWSEVMYWLSSQRLTS